MTNNLEPFDLEELDDAEFEEIIQTNFQGPKPAILIGTISLRGVLKISLSFSQEAIAKLDGWPRFTMAYHAEKFVLRIRAQHGAPFEAYELKTGRPSKEKRFILRVPMPGNLQHVPKTKEPAPHKYSTKDNKTLNIQIPPVFRRTPPKLIAPPKPALSAEEIRRLVPAPSYATKKPGL